VTDPLGATTHYGYDPAGRLGSVTDPTGATTRLLRDRSGAIAEIGLPRRAATKIWRTPRGRSSALGAEATLPGSASPSTPPAGPSAFPPLALRKAPRPPRSELPQTTWPHHRLPAGDLYRHDPAGQLVGGVPDPGEASAIPR